MSDAAVAQLLSRLEAVTARLEAIEKTVAAGGGAGGGGAAAASAAPGEVSKAVAEFDNLVATYINEYVSLSAKIDPLVKQQADLVQQAIQTQRDLIFKASQSKKPDTATFQGLLKPTSDLITKIVALRDANRPAKAFNHLSTISEGIPALGWVAAPPTPGPFVDEARASSEFYSNKLLMQYRKDESAEGKTQVAWVTAWNTFLKELRQYIKNYHTTDLTWNPQGGDVSKVASAPAAAAPASSAGGPPPPPAAGPPPPPAVDLSAAASGGASAHAALFAEINAVKERQAGGKTAGLRHVTKDMKTKNQDKSAAPAPVSSSTPAARKPAAAAAPKLGPPKFELDGQKWKIENQVGNREIVIDNPETRQTVYIYKCQDSVIQIKGKVNSIMLDSCKKVGLVFENAISVAEVVNCISVQVQITGRVPSVAVDKTSGCQIFLSADGLDTEIVTSKSDEMNVVLPPLNPTDDITELPVPEQFRTLVKDRKLVTEAVQHSG